MVTHTGLLLIGSLLGGPDAHHKAVIRTLPGSSPLPAR